MALQPSLLSTHPHQVPSHQHQHHLLSDLVLQSFKRQMSLPDNLTNSLTWKRLHLSRAKLKASSRTSALLSGFAMVAMVEVQLDESEGPLPMWLLVAFAACTTLLVSVHMLALMISTCISPHIEAIASVPGLFSVAESPHEKMSFYVEVAWAFSTVFGILLFMIEIIILCWLKFWGIGRTDGSGSGRVSSIVATVILIPVVVTFIAFAVHFYRKLVAHQHERTTKDLDELENMMSQLQDGGENATNVFSGDNLPVSNSRTTIHSTLPVSNSRTTIQSTLPENIQLHEVTTI